MNNTIQYVLKQNNFRTKSISNTDSIYLDVFKMFIIIFIGSLAIYYINVQMARTLYYVTIFVMFMLSKNDKFWIALLFLMSSSIFGMFALIPYRWIIQLTSRVGVGWTTFISIVMVAKYHNRYGYKNVPVFDALKNKYQVFKYYLIVLVLWGAAFGYSAATLLMIWGSLTGFLLFAYLPTILSYNNLLYISKIIFAFSLILFGVTIIELVFGNIITSLFHHGARRVVVTMIGDEELSRQFLGTNIFYYSVIMPLFYIANKKKDFSTIYLLIVVSVSWMSILNTATRGWMIATIVLMIMFMILYAKKLLTMLFVPKIILTVTILSILVYVFIPQQFTRNLTAAVGRLSTLESIITEGDMSAGGTASRWDYRGPIVLNKYRESPLFGFGFSNATQNFWDGHVGNHSLLLHSGIVGFVIVYLTVIAFIIYFFKKELEGLRGVGVFGLAFISMMIIHSTSRNMISYSMSNDLIFLICLMFAQYNTYAQMGKNA